MNKKIIIFCLVVILIIIGAIVTINKKNNIQISNEEEVINISQTESGDYVIKNNDGIDIYTNSVAEAEWYKTHPDYNPEPVHVESEYEENY